MPAQHHRRLSNRWDAWDYTSPGVYFVTICTHGREPLFDDACYRVAAESAWQSIPFRTRASHVRLDEWVVMPDHLHGILLLIDRVGAPEKGTVERHNPSSLQAGSVGAIIGNFKSLVARRVNVLRRLEGGTVWQRGYYDRVVRDERELQDTRRYIRENPLRHREQRDNLDALLARMRYVP